MARPDIKTERREQILDAFEQCVARYGIEGATLAKTAEAAGLARPLVRHNVGNREELIDALIERYLKKSRDGLSALLAALPEEGASSALVDILFDPSLSDPQLVQVANALIAASADHLLLARRMQAWLDEFISRLDEVFAKDFPDADPEQVAAVAAGVTGIYFNVEALYPLGRTDALVAASKRAALTLIASLEPAR